MNDLKINVSPSSDEGHFVKCQVKDQVVNLDNINETFLINGKTSLVTKNHTTLDQVEDCLITCQVEYNPLSNMYEKVRD